MTDYAHEVPDDPEEVSEELARRLDLENLLGVLADYRELEERSVPAEELGHRLDVSHERLERMLDAGELLGHKGSPQAELSLPLLAARSRFRSAAAGPRRALRHGCRCWHGRDEPGRLYGESRCRRAYAARDYIPERATGTQARPLLARRRPLRRQLEDSSLVYGASYSSFYASTRT